MKKTACTKIALVGCGGMARNYRKNYTLIPDAELALVVDADEETAKQAAQELGAKWSTDFKEALMPEIDIVDISTPNYLHAEQAIAALNAGKHILLQKPIAPTVKEGKAIIDAARSNGKKAGIYMSMFDNPLYHDIKKLIEKGSLGQISSVYCRGAHSGGLSSDPGGWRKSREKTGGGAFIQLAVHYINMAQWLLNDKIARVAGFSKNIMCPNIGGDDVTNAACEFESGIQGSLEASYCSAPNILAIYGTKGFLTVFDDFKLDIRLSGSYDGDVIKYHNPGELMDFRYSFHDSPTQYDQHIAFVKAIQTGGPIPVEAEIGLYDLKAVKAIYKSAELKSFVEVGEVED